MSAWDLASEQVVLGAMMVAPSEIIPVAEIVDTPDFYRPAHQVIFDQIINLYAAGQPTDPVAVSAALIATGEITKVGGAPYLHTLMSSVPVAANAGYYARIVRDMSVRRHLETAGERLAQRAREWPPDGDPAELLADAEQLLADVGRRTSPDVDVMDIGRFAIADLPYGAPVIDGLLHEQERIVLVAAEGVGKTEAGLQAAVMTAAGLHVFTATWLDRPAVSLIVDLENPSASVQRRIRRLLGVAETVPGWDANRCHIWSKPGGIDLRDAADRRKLMTAIGKANPKLIVAGPVTKMSVDRGERPEQQQGSVVAFWDQVREQHGCALWLEHHAPMGPSGGTREMRPKGSGLWMSWPEFGISFVESDDDGDPSGTVKVGSFRGHREDRVWPVKLERDQPWSWRGVYARL